LDSVVVADGGFSGLVIGVGVGVGVGTSAILKLLRSQM
jgi:hypothetical protein